MFRSVFLKLKENTLRIGDIAHFAKVYKNSTTEVFEQSVQERGNREAKTGTNNPVVKFSLTAKDVKDRINSFDSEIIRRLLGAMIGNADDLTIIDSDLCSMQERLTLFDSLESQFSTEIEEMRTLLK